LEDAEQLLETVSDEWNLVGESAITREFVHADFLAGSSFLTHIAAVAQMNDHFPSLALQRQLDSKKKAWRVVSSVTCSTKVLQGLSHHDFFLATVSLGMSDSLYV
jgi:pterin-4a-carbinolamine dehydratase